MRQAHLLRALPQRSQVVPVRPCHPGRPSFLQDGGATLRGSAAAAEELINQALALDPKQPLALHLHIHIAEAASPQRCLPILLPYVWHSAAWLFCSRVVMVQRVLCRGLRRSSRSLTAVPERVRTTARESFSCSRVYQRADMLTQ